jgi:hypothetical protein
MVMKLILDEHSRSKFFPKIPTYGVWPEPEFSTIDKNTHFVKLWIEISDY